MKIGLEAHRPPGLFWFNRFALGEYAVRQVNLDAISNVDDSFNLLAELKQQKAAMKPIVLSMHAEPDYVERALRAGARVYVTKDDADEKIIEAIQKVMAGGLYLDEATSEIVLQRMVSGPEKSLEEKVNKFRPMPQHALMHGQFKKLMVPSFSPGGTVNLHSVARVVCRISNELSEFQ